MTDAGGRKSRQWALGLALLWLVLVIALGASLPGRLERTGGLDNGLMALLPESTRSPGVTQAVERITETANKKLVFLIGHREFAAAARAADALKTELTRASTWLSVLPPVDSSKVTSAIEFLRPYRGALLTAADRDALEQGGGKLVEQTLAELYQPFSAPKFFELEEDPLGLASHFVLERATSSGLEVRDGRLVLERDGLTWIMVAGELRADALSFSAEEALAPVLEEAAASARRAGAQRVLRSGFIFHAAKAATSANQEMSTIGLGSLIGVILLMWLPFGTPRPVFLVLLPVAVGTLVAFGVSAWVFERVHLLTLVFGSSIVGVAEDFGVHYVCGALRAGFDPWRHLRHIARGLALAALTTLAGYAALAGIPFPGLRQMGVFGAAGLLGAWITAMLWLPLLSKNLGRPKTLRIVPALMRLEMAWPRFGASRALYLVLGALTLAGLIGVLRARPLDDVRALYDSVPELTREDDELRKLLRLPAGAQFFLVSGASEEEVLQNEEALTRVLARERKAGRLTGWQALSDSVPSPARQRENRELVKRVAYAQGGGVERLFDALEDGDALAAARSAFPAEAPTLELSSWLASPLSVAERHLWLGSPSTGPQSVVLLRGVPSQEALAQVSRAAANVKGVVLVDHVAAISAVLGGFRRVLSWFLPFGHLGVALGLSLFYGRRAWRVVVPCALASVLAVGLPSLFGQALTLSHLLALVMVLGIGIDYGIFLNEPRDEEFSVAFLSVTLGAISTLLSFGLLATSGTPALANFGLTLLVGISASWCLTPCFARAPRSGNELSSADTKSEIHEVRC